VLTSDAVAAGVEGLLTERIDVGLQAGLSRGDVFGADRETYEAATGTLRLGVALSRVLAVFSELYYYRYLGTQGALIIETSGGLERYGVRVGLGLWLPIIRERRQS
jgi:hypothetical protein